jgi:hypothetical protein
MRIVLLTALLALAGCSVVPTRAWTFDATHAQARPPADAAQAAPLTNRIAQLQLELNDIRAHIASEPDAWQRQTLYRQLHSVGRELSPLQRELDLYASSR